MLDTIGRRNNRKLLDVVCPKCGSVFRPKRRLSSYCSRPCARSKNGGHNKKPESWWQNPRGYIEGRVWIDGVPRDVKQHRHVMEHHIGRRLDASEDVHHINGIRTDNRIENLALMTHGEHTRDHNLSREHRRGYTLNLSAHERAARSERMREMRRAAIAKAVQS